MPEGGISPDFKSPERDIPYERKILARSGNMLTYTGKDIFNTSERIALLLGTDKPEQVELSKGYTLHYNDTEFDAHGELAPHWTVIDGDDRTKSWRIEDGIPFAVGRSNQALLPEEEARKHPVVSREHIALVTSDDKATIIQRSPTNRTFVDAPQTSFVKEFPMSEVP